jgi:hypothetical protein
VWLDESLGSLLSGPGIGYMPSAKIFRCRHVAGAGARWQRAEASTGAHMLVLPGNWLGSEASWTAKARGLLRAAIQNCDRR